MAADQFEPGAELIIRHPEERFARKHARVAKRFQLSGQMDMEEELPDDDADGELHGEKLLVAKRVAAARLGGAIQMGEVIEGIIARDNLERPISPPALMPEQPRPQRAGPSELNAHLQPFCRRIE